MTGKRFIVELGTGMDLHGQDPTKAAARAVKDAIGRSCLCGVVEIVNLQKLDDMHVDILVAVPDPERVDAQAVLAVVPFGQKTLRAVSGGLRAPGMYQPELGDQSPDVFVANAAITVWISGI